MCGKFSVGFRGTSERATLEPQHKDASLDLVYMPMHPVPISTLPGTTQMVTPLAKSTPITQSSQMPAYQIHCHPFGIYWNQLPMSNWDPPVWRGK